MGIENEAINSCWKQEFFLYRKLIIMFLSLKYTLFPCRLLQPFYYSDASVMSSSFCHLVSPFRKEELHGKVFKTHCVIRKLQTIQSQVIHCKPSLRSFLFFASVRMTKYMAENPEVHVQNLMKPNLVFWGNRVENLILVSMHHRYKCVTLFWRYLLQLLCLHLPCNIQKIAFQCSQK